MARFSVVSKVPAAQIEVVNAYMVGLLDPDVPDAQEITLNAYVDGQPASVATHSVGDANCSADQKDNLLAYLATVDGCDGAAFPAGEEDAWAEALTRWNLKPANP